MLTLERIRERAEDMRPTVLATLKQAWMEGDWFRLTDQVVSHYATKAAVCSIALSEDADDATDCRVFDIIEIGTRCGYALSVFRVVAPGARILCLDGEMDEDSKQCLLHAERLIVRNDVDAALIRVDTDNVIKLPGAEFAHVDGDHTYSGALRDLRLVAACPVILADDCDNHAVRRAVGQFCLETGRPVLIVDDGLRTIGVIQ